MGTGKRWSTEMLHRILLYVLCYVVGNATLPTSVVHDGHEVHEGKYTADSAKN